MVTARYLTRKSFKMVAAQGAKMGFNRQIAPWVLSKLVKGQFTATPLMTHERASGAKVQPHLRTLVQFRLKNGEKGSAILDMTEAMFESLPIFERSTRRGRKYQLAQPSIRFCVAA